MAIEINKFTSSIIVIHQVETPYIGNFKYSIS